ncbi:hypothetical protein [Fibrella aestuarina]|uniref:hypothetical protein n=1 Tax=Fibrella aestuarina TaxID=651143 RepID=UPI0011D1A9FD|nr:hypothetical protein [Fibrella aestuarina]
MIPVTPKQEPGDFDIKVRQKGLKFLKTTPRPRGSEWIRKEYWRKCIPELQTSYDNICAYCAIKIPAHTGDPTVDHYISRDVDPSLAYEWANFRLAARRFNSRKLNYTIVDPFTVQYGWFVLDFRTYLIHPNNQPNFLDSNQYSLVDFTIRKLKLNIDDNLVQARLGIIRDYVKNKVQFSYLQENAPFIAYELGRQNLVHTIQSWNV